MSFFDANSSFWQSFSRVMDFFGLSLCCMFLSLPIVTAGSAVCALYDSVYHGLRMKESGVYLRFWRTFRRELKTTAAVTLMLIAAYGIYRLLFAISYTVAVAGDPVAGVLVYAYRVLFLVPVGVWVVAVVLLSRFTFSTKGLVATAVRLFLMHPALCAAVTAVALAAFWVISWWPFSGVFVPACAAYIASAFAERIFDRYIEE